MHLLIQQLTYLHVQSSPLTHKLVLAGLPLQQRLAASVVVGLLNRQAQRPSALGLINPSDQAWLGTALAEEPVLNASTIQQVESLAQLGDAASSSGTIPPPRLCFLLH